MYLLIVILLGLAFTSWVNPDTGGGFWVLMTIFLLIGSLIQGLANKFKN